MVSNAGGRRLRVEVEGSVADVDAAAPVSGFALDVAAVASSPPSSLVTTTVPAETLRSTLLVRGLAGAEDTGVEEAVDVAVLL